MLRASSPSIGTARHSAMLFGSSWNHSPQRATSTGFEDAALFCPATWALRRRAAFQTPPILEAMSRTPRRAPIQRSWSLCAV